MAYINISTLKFPVYENDIRLEYPDITLDQTGTSFPCPDTYAAVVVTNKPPFDPSTQFAMQVGPVELNGVWQTSWEIHTYRDYELEAIAEMNAKKNAEKDLGQSGSAPDIIG